MQSSGIFKIVILCVFAYSIFSFFSFRGGDFSFGSTTFNGPTVTKEYQLDDFHSISLGVAANLKIKNGDSNTVKIEAPEDLIELINKEVSNGKWKVKINKRMRWNMRKDINIWVEMDDIQALSVGGSGTIETEDHFDGLNEVDCSIAGSGDVIIRGNMDDLDASISGSGNFTLYGAGNDCELSISGSGHFEAREFEAKNVDISISGSGEAYVHAIETLDASVSGSGDVRYKGNAKVNSKTSGSGSVKSID